MSNLLARASEFVSDSQIAAYVQEIQKLDTELAELSAKREAVRRNLRERVQSNEAVLKAVARVMLREERDQLVAAKAEAESAKANLDAERQAARTELRDRRKALNSERAAFEAEREQFYTDNPGARPPAE